MRVEYEQIEKGLVGSVEEGMLLVDKPAGVSSFGVVAMVWGAIWAELEGREKNESDGRGGVDGKSGIKGVRSGRRKVKVGHTGTLDPFATGLLILMIGKGTKRCQEFLKLDKWYEAELKLGMSSTTGDPEGEIEPGSVEEVRRAQEVTEEEVREAMRKMTGEIWQTVPKFSAVKIEGRRAYDLARKGEEVEMPKRKVTVYEWELMGVKEGMVKFRCHVSSGTYVRTLGEDLARELGTVGYLTGLRRLTIGDYRVEDAVIIRGQCGG